MSAATVPRSGPDRELIAVNFREMPQMRGALASGVAFGEPEGRQARLGIAKEAPVGAVRVGSGQDGVDRVLL